MPITYEPISSVTISSAVSNITLSSIPNGFTDLRIILTAIQPTGTGQQAMLRFNGDSGSNYSLTYLDADGASCFSGRLSNQTDFAAYYVPPNGTNSSIVSVIDIMSYSNTSVNKTITIAHTSSLYLGRYVASWRSNSIINSISTRVTTGGNFQPGSTISLFGIKAA